jgi:hypothetical protein
MQPIAGAAWSMPDREWGLCVHGDDLVVLERRGGAPTWSEIHNMPLPQLIAGIEEWVRTVVVPALQALRDAIWPPAPAEAAPTATVASVLSERLGRGAVQYNYTTGRFGYVPHDPGNV